MVIHNSNQTLEEKEKFETIPLDATHIEELSIGWGDGTLFIVSDEEIISDFFQLTSGKVLKLESADDI